MTEYREITYTATDSVAVIALDRPDARNGYTATMADELRGALDVADADDGVRAVILTGNGKDFCVGADLSGGSFALEDSAQDGDFWPEPAGRCSMRVFAMNKPVIAAVRGAAVGAGSTIILACDYRLAATDSRFGFVFSRRGIYPEGASVWFLPRLVGLGTAMDWMVSGRVFDAAEAHAAGMVHSLHEPDAVLDAAHGLAADLAANTAPVSVAVIRQMLYRLSPADSPRQAQRVDSSLIARLAQNPDAHEGVASFLEKRAPRFPGTVGSDLPDYLPWSEPTAP